MNAESKRWKTLVGVFYNHTAEYFSLKWKQLKKDKAAASCCFEASLLFEQRFNTDGVFPAVEPPNGLWTCPETGLSLFTAVLKEQKNLRAQS